MLIYLAKGHSCFSTGWKGKVTESKARFGKSQKRGRRRRREKTIQQLSPPAKISLLEYQSK